MGDEQTKSLWDVKCKRLYGVKRPPFDAMCEELQAVERAKIKPGCPGQLSLEEQWVLTLWYGREYRTLFHWGTTLGVSEATAHRRVRRVEDTLIRAGRFPLPKRTERLSVGTSEQRKVAACTIALKR